MNIEQQVDNISEKIDGINQRLSDQFEDIAYKLGGMEASIDQCKPSGKILDATSVKMIIAIVVSVLSVLGIEVVSS